MKTCTSFFSASSSSPVLSLFKTNKTKTKPDQPTKQTNKKTRKLNKTQNNAFWILDHRQCRSAFTDRWEKIRQALDCSSFWLAVTFCTGPQKGGTNAKSSGTVELKKKALGFVEDQSTGICGTEHQRGENDAEKSL